jgi:hypothetical protein
MRNRKRPTVTHNEISTMSPLIVRYPTWQELYGTRPTESDLLTELCGLERFHTMLVLCQMNLLLALDRFHSNDQGTTELQTFLVNLLIDDELFTRLRDTFGHEKLVDLRPFHSLQVLTLMKKVMLDSSKVGGLQPGMDTRANISLGRCLMMTNDLLVSEKNIEDIASENPPAKRKIALQMQIGSSMEISNPPQIFTSVVRSDLIFGHLVNDVQSSLNLRKAFEQGSGITLEDYVDHILGLLTYYITLDFHKLVGDPSLSYIATKTFFAESPPEAVEKFWQKEMITIDQLEVSLREPTELKPHLDYLPFRKSPFIQVAEGSAIALHLGFVQEKLESGLFWAVVNSVSASEERDLLFTYWGHLFEEYVSRMLAGCFQSSPTTFFPFSPFSDNEEEGFDGILCEGRRLVVMEYKGGFLKATAKYADDESKFLHDLGRKFGAGRGAGVEQLIRKLGAVFAANPKQRRAITGLDTSRIETIIPVLIVQDSFVSSEITASLLTEIFATMKEKVALDRSICCTPLLVMDISDIEMLKPFLIQQTVSLVDCLTERATMEVGRFLSFRDFFRMYRHDRNIKMVYDVETLACFKQIMNRISLRFFGKPLNTEP